MFDALANYLRGMVMQLLVGAISLDWHAQAGDSEVKDSSAKREQRTEISTCRCEERSVTE
jgi:hypothetical protein